MERERCPICNKSFPITELPQHVDECLNSSQTPASPQQHFSPPQQQSSSPQHQPLSPQQQQPAASTGLCPICSQSVPLDLLNAHVNDCLSAASFSPPPQDRDQISQDEALARKLAEDLASPGTRSGTSLMIRCQKCEGQFQEDKVYLLDDCGHRFCKDCLGTHVNREIAVALMVLCPLQGCQKSLSVRDMKDLLIVPQPQAPYVPPQGGGTGLLGFMQSGTKKGSVTATKRLLSELKHISDSQPEKQGYSVAPINDNLYHWKVEFFNFDPKDELGRELAKAGGKVILEVTFPTNFPYDPPFFRIVRPRFQYRTGHVTIGGSICMELTTRKGWSPANSVEAVLMTIRAQLADGGARIDFHNRSDYSFREAQDAFHRMVQVHGWG